MINTTNPKAERATLFIFDESDILKDILKALNRRAKAEPHKPLLEVLDEWGRLNEKRMKGKHSTRRDKRNITN